MSVRVIAPERIRIRDHFSAIIGSEANHSADIARKLERGVFDVVVRECERDGIDRLFTDQKFIARYSAATSRISYNLDNSPDLIDRLLDGLDPDSCGSMTSEQLWPQANLSERDEIDARCRAAARDGKVSRRYVCGVCGNNRTVYLEYQARAADECSSQSIKCVTCGHVWRG